MPDDRMIHRRAARSEKVSSLTDFEFRVWVQFELSADDFGVLLYSASKLKGDNRYFDKKGAAGARMERAIEKALATLINVGLVQTFEHQGEGYLFQHDWQDWQKVKHARHTVQPFPPADALARCTEKTRTLFLEQHNGRVGEEVPQSSSNPSEIFPPLAHAGAQVTANGKRLEANGSRQTAAVAVRRPRSMGALGSSPAQHIGHARCNDRGVCIPTQKFYGELLGRFANDMTRFDAFYNRVLETMPEDYVPTGSVFEFWHDMLASAFPESKPGKQNERAAALRSDF